MTPDSAFERRLTAELHAELDREVGPHPAWSDSPASARIGMRRGSEWRPARLLAIAAVLAVAGGLAVALGSRLELPQDAAGIEGCPTLADYAAASAVPLPTLGEAPGVTFPPVAPEATATTGLIQPGTWAVIADAKGPLAQIRVRDVRECGRLPEVRSGWVGGKLILATADVRIVRDEPGFAWLGPDMFYVGLGGVDTGQSPTEPYSSVSPAQIFGVPGFDHRTQLNVPVGFSTSSTLIADVPPGAIQAVLYPALTEAGRVDPSKPGWLLQAGPTSGLVTFAPWPSLAATETTGEVALGDFATIKDLAGDVALTVTDVDQVDGYPGLTPSPGHVFVESRISLPGTAQDTSDRVIGTWRALDGSGRELPFLVDADPATSERGIPLNLGSPTLRNVPDSLLVVEAPPIGLIRLELTKAGETQPLLSYVVRRP